jgi:DNA-binding transcriptional ArsR family regulator
MKHTINSRPFKDAIYQSLSKVGKTLASPKRLEILDLLSQGPKTVEALAKETTMSIANVSQHLQTLLEAHLVRFHKKGTYVIYELADDRVSQFLLTFRNLAEQSLAEVPKIKNEFFQAFDNAEPIGTLELAELLKGNVQVVDVRPFME